VAELGEENSSLMKQLDSAQIVTGGDAVSDVERAGNKVDKNANFETTHVSDRQLTSDAEQLENKSADDKQVGMF